MAMNTAFNEKYPLPDEQVYNGIHFPGQYYCNFKEDFDIVRDFKVRNTDVAIMSFLRTGSRWMAEVVSWICSACDEKAMADTHNFLRALLLELTYPRNTPAILSALPESTTRIFASHLYRDLAPEQIENGRVICPVRNPKDNAVSYYNLYRIANYLGCYKGGWDEFLQAYMGGYLAWGSYFDWLRSWWPMKDHKNVLFVFYEESKKDPVKMIRRVSEFLGKDLTEEQVQTIAKNTSFSAMKNSPLTNASVDSSQFSFLFDREAQKTAEFVRKGQVGDWKNYFTEEQNKEIEEMICEKLGDLDINFSYEI